VNTSCNADDVDGRRISAYPARERQRLPIVVLAIVIFAIVVFAAGGLAIVVVGTVVARAPDVVWRGVMVLMIVCMLAELLAGSMRACFIGLESSQALSAPLSYERKVGCHVHTHHRSSR